MSHIVVSGEITDLEEDMIAGGDWNVVPDVLLDVQSSNPLNYENNGAALLEQATNGCKLWDFRRDQLEGDFEATRIGNNRNGATATPRR